ncbi:MAG: hypothetical protein JXM74_03300, partial [Fusobacteriaceae bacterium]|nr:hypothetical protein [Fusobacteriaceae bacterium]
CMNLQPGGGGGISGEEHNRKLNIARSKIWKKFREEHLYKLKNDLEYREKYSKSVSISKKGKSNGWLGKHHSDKTKEKLRKPKNSGVNNPQYGTCWITNGIENKKIHKIDIIPNGWYLGRKIKIKD